MTNCCDGRPKRKKLDEIGITVLRWCKCPAGQARKALYDSLDGTCWCLGHGTFDGERFCYCPTGKDLLTAENARQRAAMMAGAGVPSLMRDWTFDTLAKITGKSLEDDPAKRWIETSGKPGLLLIGGCGVGKTGRAIACLAGFEDALADGDALFVNVPELMEARKAGYRNKADSAAEELFARAKTVEFVVLDDLGAEQSSEWSVASLFSLVNARHGAGEDLLTIVTTNLTPLELAEHLGERTAWRLLEMCEVVYLDGPNLRARLPGGVPSAEDLLRQAGVVGD
jgi:DNA replication protein DnaC